MRSCAHEDSVTTGQRHKKENLTIARATTCSKRHVSARVICSFCPNRCLSAHRLGLRSQRFRHLASALSTTALPAPQTPRECSVHLPLTTTPASKGWIPDRSVTKEQQLHWRVIEPSNTPTLLDGSQTRSGNQQRTKQQGEHLPALPCKTSGAVGSKRKTTPLCRSSTDRRTCLVSTHNMHFQSGARQHKDVRRSVSSCSLPLCGRCTKTFPHSWMTCLQVDSLSHGTLYDIVFHSARFCAQRQLMPCFTSAAIADDW